MVSHSEPLSDPGGARRVTARWVIIANLVLKSGAHFGGGVGYSADMVVLRDGRFGKPMLPGTSLAGALRSHLADVLCGYRSREDIRADSLFGSADSDGGFQSPLIVFDSIGILPDRQLIEVRDGVQIDAEKGIAEDHKKYDMELLPPGTRFPVRFDLIVVSEQSSEDELVSLLAVALSGFDAGDIPLGMRRSRGLGSLRAEHWRVMRYDLACKAGWMEWVMTDAESPISLRPAFPDVTGALNSVRAEHLTSTLTDARDRLIAIVHLTSKGSLLVRSAPTTAAAPDAVHLTSGNVSVLPGTSLAGVLRARAVRIARVVRAEYKDASLWVNRMFGPRMAGVTKSDSTDLTSSRLRISESELSDGVRMRASRVRIDRFTQGAWPGSLFDEEPDFGAHVSIKFELRNPEPGEAGLLFLVLRDLLTGDLAVGGSSAVGRGMFIGTAEVTTSDGSTIILDPSDTTPAEAIDSAIEEFWSCQRLEANQ